MRCVVIGLIFSIPLWAGIIGCTSTYVSYKTPNGSDLSVHRRNCLSKAEMPSVKFNADGTVEVLGYKNDGGSETIKDIVGTAVKSGVNAALGK